MVAIKRATTALLAGLSTSLALMAVVVDSKEVEYTWKLKPRRASANDPSLSPDCNLNRLMLLVNDQYPGPAIEANVGDTVVSADII